MRLERKLVSQFFKKSHVCEHGTKTVRLTNSRF